MNVSIVIPTPLRQYAGGQKVVAVSGTTVGQALDALTTTHPDLKRHLFGEDGKLRSFVNVYLGDEDVRHLQQSETPLMAGATLSIVPSVAGGNELPSAQRTNGWCRSRLQTTIPDDDLH